jgi:hypothetical protein
MNPRETYALSSRGRKRMKMTVISGITASTLKTHIPHPFLRV